MPEQGASFIPKSGAKTVQRNRGTRRIYLLAYISYIVFFSTLFVVVGVYLYAATINRNLTSLREQLSVEQQRFAVSDIEQVKTFDKRMSEATRLLEESSAPSRIFSDIESIVASNIYFSSMTYSQLPNRQFEIELVGRATNFNQLINQEDLLENSQLLKDATITSYDYGLGGGEGDLSGTASLSFTFADTRDLSIISYQPNASESTVVVSSSSATTTTEMVVTETSSQATTTSETEDSVVVGEARPADSEEEVTTNNPATQ